MPEVVSVQPCGAQVLFEELTERELMGPTKIELPIANRTSSKGAPQAYIIALGPKVDPEWGLKVGQRVVISGTYTPVPEFSGTHGRRIGVCEPHNIKAILVEAE